MRDQHEGLQPGRVHRVRYPEGHRRRPRRGVPGSLYEASNVLGQADINIEYGYAFTGKNVEGLFIRVDNPEKAIEALSKAGLELVKASEI